MENTPVLFSQKLKNINNGQKTLLRLICKKHNKRELIGRDEITKIYKEEVQRNKLFLNYYYDHDEKKYKTERIPYNEYQIEFYVTSWVLRALGALIRKGYLTVMPRIDFSKNCSTEE